MVVWEHLADEACWVAKDISYCTRPSAPHLQRMHIYVPEAFLDEKGKTNEGSRVVTAHGAEYSAHDVPVVFYNDIGGYSECVPAELTNRNRRFLQDGYVLVSTGARGRQTRREDGTACGKVPAGLVDLKAALRWLRAHADELPAGDLNKIVSVGTSAGGAMSSLLATTGNSPLYDAYLDEIGAELDQSDEVFASQCYCPIVDLEHADMAYEWMYGAKRICTFGPHTPPRVLSENELLLSEELAGAYPAYVNSLTLGVTLGQDGRSGSYYDALMEQVTESLEVFLDRSARNDKERRALISELDPSGSFIHEKRGVVRIDDLDAYVRCFIGRMKGCPSFDSLAERCPENHVFGNSGAREGAAEDYAAFSHATMEARRRVAARVQVGADEAPLLADDERVAALNPMTFLDRSAGARSDTAKAQHVRVCVGSADAHHSFSASFNLFCALKAWGVDASYHIVWGCGHCDADYPGQFSAWVDTIAQNSRLEP